MSQRTRIVVGTAVGVGVCLRFVLIVLTALASDELGRGRTIVHLGLQLGGALTAALIAVVAYRHLFADVKRLALKDHVTGLANRPLFMERLVSAMSRSERIHRPIAVVFVDLDHFKLVNDSLGHPAGDRLLIEVAHRLRKTVRLSETVARFGGDEFTVLLEDLHSAKAPALVAERIREALSQPIALLGGEVRISASLGIAVSLGTELEPEEIVRRADVALYEAKGTGRNRVCFYEPDASAPPERQMECDFRFAIDEGQLCLHFLPRFDVPTGRLDGLEALVRWQHPSRGLLAPGDFLESAAATGQMRAIDFWVLRTASEDAAKWRERFPDLRLSLIVNIAASSLVDPNSVFEIKQILERAGLAPEELEIDLVGDFPAQNQDRAPIESLFSLGVHLVVSDLAILSAETMENRWLQLSNFKVSGSTLEAARANEGIAAMAQSAIALAHRLGMTVSATGIENSAQIAYLANANCDKVQGFHFSRPVPQEALWHFLAGQAIQAA